MKRKNVLFISSDATRSGAPIVLFHFLRWLKTNANISYQIALRGGGELEPQFKTLAPVVVLKMKLNIGSQFLNKAIYRFSFHDFVNRSDTRVLKKQFVQGNIDLIYSNTITNGEILECLAGLRCPVVTHVHELGYWIHRAGAKNLRQVKKHTHYYIAVSEAVKRNLVEKCGIPETKISVVHGFIPTGLYNNQNYKDEVQNEIRKELNIPQEAQVVGGSGTFNWCKSPDLFIQLAKAAYQRKLPKPVYFIWVGGEDRGSRFNKLWQVVKRERLERYIRFVGVKSNSLDNFSLFDVFALVSREDSFPLTMLETAYLGKPIVCFEGAGGAKEFIESDCGYTVPYLNIESMADKVVLLLKDSQLRQRLGQKAMQKAKERHDIEIGAPKIVDIINKFLLK